MDTDDRIDSLTPAQRRAALLLALGVPQTEIARDVDKSQQMICHWKKLPAFRALVNKFVLNREQKTMESVANIREIALRELSKLIEDPDPKIRLRAVEFTIENLSGLVGSASLTSLARNTMTPERVGEGPEAPSVASELQSQQTPPAAAEPETPSTSVGGNGAILPQSSSPAGEAMSPSRAGPRSRPGAPRTVPTEPTPSLIIPDVSAHGSPSANADQISAPDKADQAAVGRREANSSSLIGSVANDSATTSPADSVTPSSSSRTTAVSHGKHSADGSPPDPFSI